MSQPPNTSAIPEPALRWTGLLVWLGLLFACALSSIYLIVGVIQGSVYGNLTGLTESRISQGEEELVALTAFVLTAAAALALLGAWYTIGVAAHHLIDDAVNGSDLEGAGAPEGWLRGSGNSPFSLPGATAILLGATWSILLISTQVLALMRVLLRD